MKRRKILLVGVTSTFVIFGLLLWGITIIGDRVVDSKVVSRAASPDRKYECVVLERNGGATTSMVYWIFLVPFGERVDDGNAELPTWIPGQNRVRIANLDGAMKNQGGYGVEVHWRNPENIIIDCSNATVLELRRDVSLGARNFHTEFGPTSKGLTVE